MTKIVVGILIVIAAIVAGLAAWWMMEQKQIAAINSFETCAKLYPVMESYPPRCATPDGRSFTQDVGNEIEKMDLIRITSPRPTETVKGTTLKITGEARGPWFFEASFPVHLDDKNGNRLATAIATADGEWMTVEFVPFRAELVLPPTFHGPANLIFEKDNPSGLPEHDDSLRVPITVE